MTNADVIRKMTDKQLFDFLSEWECGDIDYSITFCDLCEQGKSEGGKGNELGLDCDGCREHWLKRDAVDYSGLLYWKKNTTYGERGRGMSKYIDLGKVKEMVFNADISMAETEALYKSLDNLPTIDIVHCEECKHNENTCINHGEMSPRCRFVNYKRSADDFCSHGERKDNE